ncbi:MAG: hypothetical protein JRI25_10250 [Deltaproteobacteria bacterium]|nr:hypothetical protein [Deltaproteobacteria bacterium]
MDDTTRRRIEPAEAELDRLLRYFPDLANPIMVGWLALRVEGWRREAGSSEAPEERIEAAPARVEQPH